MSVHVGERDATRAASELAQANYEALKSDTLRSVAAKLHGEGATGLPHADLDAAYNEAWHTITIHAADGKPIRSLPGLLCTITHRRVIDSYRSARGALRVELDLTSRETPTDLVEEIDASLRLDGVFEQLKRRLTDRERRALTLCTIHGYSRAEAANLLGLRPRTFERVIDNATRKLGGILAATQTRGCGEEEWARLIRAYALGTLNPTSPDYQRARTHLEGPEGCEACRRYTRGLRGLAGLLPPLLPAGRGLLRGGPLGLLHRLLHGGHTTTAAAPGAITAGAAGSSTGASAGTLGVGITSKTVLLIGTALTLATGTVIATHNHPVPPRPHQPAVHARVTPTAESTLAHAIQPPRPRKIAPAGTPHPRAARLTSRRQVRRAKPAEAPTEFGFETSTKSASEAPQSAAAASIPPPSKPAAATAHSEGSPEFGFESH